MLRRNKMISKIESIKKLYEFIQKPNNTSLIIDAGANIGDFTGALLELFPDSIIMGIEPTPATAQKYRKRFSIRKNVHLFECALSHSKGNVEFHLNEAVSTTNSLLPRPKKGKIYYGKNAVTTKKIIVQTQDLDSLVNENFPQVDISILKMDLQGGELEALKGMKQLLLQQRIDIIITEAMFIAHYENQPLLNDLWSFLNNFNYSLYDLVDTSWMIEDGQIRQGDVIFISEKIRRQL